MIVPLEAAARLEGAAVAERGRGMPVHLGRVGDSLAGAEEGSRGMELKMSEPLARLPKGSTFCLSSSTSSEALRLEATGVATAC